MKRSVCLLFITALLSAPLYAQQSSLDEEPTSSTDGKSSSGIWIGLSVLLALGAGGYAWFIGEKTKRRFEKMDAYVKQIRSSQKSSKSASPVAAKPISDTQVSALDKRIGTLEKELEELRAEVQRKVRLAQQQSPARTTTRPTPQPASIPPQSSPIQVPAPATSAPVVPQTKWAKYADAGDGFSVTSLSDNQDGEKLFEISIEDAMNAKFRVVTARQPQQMALQDPTYYFSKTCQYDTLPTPQSTIVTDTPGLLKLQSGKWVIQRPAKIRFS